jgi:hypothetical protein
VSQAVHIEVEDQTGVTFGRTEVREHLRHEYRSDRFDALDLYRHEVCDHEVEPVIADAMAAIEDGAAYLPVECNTPGGELDCQASSYALSSSPGPSTRWTSIADPMIARVTVSTPVTSRLSASAAPSRLAGFRASTKCARSGVERSAHHHRR